MSDESISSILTDYISLRLASVLPHRQLDGVNKDGRSDKMSVAPLPVIRQQPVPVPGSRGPCFLHAAGEGGRLGVQSRKAQAPEQLRSALRSSGGGRRRAVTLFAVQ